MNSNELMQDLNKVLKESGWLNRANEFYQNHPEYFKEAHYSGYIASLHLSVSYQPKTLAEVQDITPCIFISMDDCNSISREFNQYNHTNKKYSCVSIKGNIITEVLIV